MKKHLFVSILSLAIGLGSSFNAAAETKIGSVDMKKIFESYWKTKDAETTMSETRHKLKRDLDEKNEKRKELQEAIEKLNEEIKKPEISKDKAQQKAKEREDKIGEWQNMTRSLQEFQQEKEKQLAAETLRIRNGLVEEIKKVIDAKAKAEGFDLVFDVSGNSINNIPVVFVANPKFDFTTEIVEKLNADRPAGKKTDPAPPAGGKSK